MREPVTRRTLTRQIAVAALAALVGTTARADDGCKCRPPSYETPVYGARALSHAELGRVIGEGSLAVGSPACAEAAERVRRLYDERGFPSARVTVVAGMDVCALRVEEGARYAIGEVMFEGVSDAARMRAASRLTSGAPYGETVLATALARLAKVKGIERPTREDVVVALDDARGLANLTIHLRSR